MCLCFICVLDDSLNIIPHKISFYKITKEKKGVLIGKINTMLISNIVVLSAILALGFRWLKLQLILNGSFALIDHVINFL